MRIEAGTSFEILKQETRWVAWRNELPKGAKAPTKVCYVPGSARRASSTDPGTWRSHAEALRMHGCDGLGFVLTFHENLSGIDLDHCFDPATGLLRPWAQEIVDSCDSYTELSPTERKGIHIWGVVDDDIGTIGFNVKTGDGDQHVEVYVRGGRGRYLTVTSKPFGEPRPLANISPAVRRLLNYRSRQDGNGAASEPSDPDAGLAWLPKAIVNLIRDGAPAGADRSAELHKVVGELREIGWSSDRIVGLLRAHPTGIAARCFEGGKGDVERQVYMSLRKIDDNIAARRSAPPPPSSPPPQNDQARWAGEGAETSWEDPDLSLLDDRRGELPEFPIAVLTEPWWNWATRVAQGAGVSVDHVAVPLLAIVAGLIGAARRIEAVSAWGEWLGLWTTVVGYSGTGKTPGLNATKRVLEAVERDRADRLAELRRQHETRVETAKAAFKHWKVDVAAAVANGSSSPPMPPEAEDPGPYVEPRLFVSDVTIEKLAVLVRARPRGALLIADELAGWARNMGRYTNGSDREFWLTAFMGDPYVVERLSRTVRLAHLLVSITGGFQPDKLASAFEGDDDGMHARLLFSWPAEPPYQELSDEIRYIEPGIYNAFVRLVDLPAGTGEVLETRTLGLTTEAKVEFEAFRHAHHNGKHELDGREREWWAKGPSQVLRLAGVLAFMEWLDPTLSGLPGLPATPEPEMVEAKQITAAVTLWREYFWPHACACIRQIGLTERHIEARRALRWLRATSTSEVSREDIRRRACGRRLDADQAQELIDRLVAVGWLRERVIETSGRHARRWEVNPMLFAS